jgi:hypothetical protein
LGGSGGGGDGVRTAGFHERTRNIAGVHAHLEALFVDAVDEPLQLDLGRAAVGDADLDHEKVPIICKHARACAHPHSHSLRCESFLRC